MPIPHAKGFKGFAPDRPDQLPSAATGRRHSKNRVGNYDKRRIEILLIPAAWRNDEMRTILLHLPAVVFPPALPMSVHTVPLLRIKSKKIPIVQPNLTFRSKKMEAD
ncbi:hypothetical protein [Rhizobium hainanense]|uniref:hypothetical protein n=1 Tax=Rhizobium hainanense TaxID=52131 RepID=UPI00096A565B|nr:hypothetical protein [Rhizobium hainanense]